MSEQPLTPAQEAMRRKMASKELVVTVRMDPAVQEVLKQARASLALAQSERDILRCKYEASQDALREMFAEFRAVGEALGAGEEEPVLAAAQRVVAERDEALERPLVERHTAELAALRTECERLREALTDEQRAVLRSAMRLIGFLRSCAECGEGLTSKDRGWIDVVMSSLATMEKSDADR